MKPKKYSKRKKNRVKIVNFINGNAVNKGKKHIWDQNIFVWQLYMKNNDFTIKLKQTTLK